VLQLLWSTTVSIWRRIGLIDSVRFIFIYIPGDECSFYEAMKYNNCMSLRSIDVVTILARVAALFTTVENRSFKNLMISI